MKSHVKDRAFLLLIVLFITTAITGCATVETVRPPVIQTHPPENAETPHGWWRASFRIAWPEDQSPAWDLDLLLAHRAISPLLDRYEKQISLWRFHRRAARDSIGHQFSFIFYSSPETAAEIYQSLRSEPLLEEMKRAGILLEVLYKDPNRIDNPNIEDTSDPNWSPEMKKAWPYYIMGVSRLWLNLIAQYEAELSGGERPSRLEEDRGLYREVNEAIGRSWQEEGRHALLHHLNAIFGYDPIKVYVEQMMRF